MSWQQLEKQLNARARSWAALNQAEQERFAYEAWAATAVPACIDDLEQELRERVLTFEASLRNNLAVTRVVPSRSGMPDVVCLALGPDEVHIHGQWEPGRAPTVHLLKCRKRADRYAQLLPLAGGWLVHSDVGKGYRIQAFTAASPAWATDLDVPLAPGVRVAATDVGPAGHHGVAPASSDEITPDQLIYRALGLLALG